MNRWLLWDVAIWSDTKNRKFGKLPPTAEVKEFFKRHPEFIEKASNEFGKTRADTI